MEKESFDLHIELMVKNLIHDQVSYNISFREAFHNIRDTHSYLKEELEEVKESLKELEEQEAKVWKMIRADEGIDNILFRLEVMEMMAKEVMIEALHTAAVARKALIQLDAEKEKAPTDGNQYKGA
ncbi:MAG: hypothetical protein RR627_11250 [Niameybacter sp.]